MEKNETGLRLEKGRKVDRTYAKKKGVGNRREELLLRRNLGS